MTIVRFNVVIKVKNREIRITKRSRIQDRIINWYNGQFNFLDSLYAIKIESIIFNYEEGNFILKYSTTDETDDEELVINKALVNPDDDGNSPMNAYGTECLVIGELI